MKVVDGAGRKGGRAGKLDDVDVFLAVFHVKYSPSWTAAHICVIWDFGVGRIRHFGMLSGRFIDYNTD